jgi:DNA repair protein RadA/Sms
VKKSAKMIYCCQACGYQTPKWMGKCPDCGTWDSIVEERAAAGPFRNAARISTAQQTVPVPIDTIELEKDNRFLTGIQEFDRVLGGGLVPGTLVLVGGDPGIGKSTLMLQALYGLANQGHKVLYVSGEESNQQIRLRSQRLTTVSSELLVVAEDRHTDLFGRSCNQRWRHCRPQAVGAYGRHGSVF